MTQPKKLIEVALPLEAINRASAREKSIRHGHPSTLHLWWARRPLAAACAVTRTRLMQMGMRSEYIRARGFEPIQQEQMALDFIRKNGRMTRAEVADLCKVGPYQALRIIVRLMKKHGNIARHGKGRGTYYTWKKK